MITKMKKNTMSTIAYESDSALSLYLKEINRIPLLTRTEETDLAKRAASGEKRAKDRLVSANLRFVVNVAKKYQNQGLPLDDLISEGNIGLINAIEKFDVEKGYHFISYAVWWIRQSILKAICEKSRSIRLPLNRANELVQIEKMRKELFSAKGSDPTAEEIAIALRMDERQVGELMHVSREMVSLESPVFTDKDTSILSDFVEDRKYSSPEDTLIYDNLRNDLNQALGSLSAKESEIIQHRFGLNDRKPLSLKEIGLKFKLTKERIRQIEKKAIQRLAIPGQAMELSLYMAG
ncbi:MAG: RNA polymerase subunit sigma [Spirochaetes bacterium GWB1_48_6]|nr:MAG: RNA polymerase subunit sigma [Spirochaetes bacterium GWB1_48_6]